MMDAQALGHKISDFPSLGRFDISHGRLVFFVPARVKESGANVVYGLLVEHLGSSLGVSAGMDKNHDLVILLQHLPHLFESHLVDVVAGLFAVGLALDSNKVLLERDRPEGGIKVEQTGPLVDAQKVGHIDVVGERGAETDDADQGLGALDLPLCPGHQRLQHSTSLVMKHVHFIDDEQPHLLNQFRVTSPLPCHDIPFLRRRHNNLRLNNLRLGQMHVAGVFAATQPEPSKPLPELPGDLSCQRLHGRNINNLEVVGLHGKFGGGVILERVWRQVLADGVHDSQHGRVCLAGTCRGADEHVLARLVGYRVYQTLHAVQGSVSAECVPA